MSAMNSEIHIIPRGYYFIISTGAYSDYSISCLCKANIDLTPNIIDEYWAENPEKIFLDWAKRPSLKSSHFINWLINIKKYAEELKFREIFLDAGEIEPIKTYFPSEDE